MTNIFARKPGINLPAKRYDLFISAFEKEVSAIQKQVSKMQKMERVYNIVRDVMEKAQLPHDTKIKLNADRVLISITAVETDRMETFEILRFKLGHAFVEAKLRETPFGSERIGGHWYNLSYSWSMRIGDETQLVSLEVSLPRKGITDYEVIEKREDYMTYSLTYEIVQRSTIVEGAQNEIL